MSAPVNVNVLSMGKAIAEQCNRQADEWPSKATSVAVWALFASTKVTAESLDTVVTANVV